MGTMDTLVQDLFREPQTAARDALINKAAAGYYHDFKSDHPTPKVALIGDLTYHGYRHLARKARSGAYDEPPDVEDEAEMAGWLAGQPRMAEIDRKLRAGEITYEQAVMAAMQTLDPEDRIRAAVELDVTRTAKREDR